MAVKRASLRQEAHAAAIARDRDACQAAAARCEQAAQDLSEAEAAEADAACTEAGLASEATDLAQTDVDAPAYLANRKTPTDKLI